MNRVKKAVHASHELCTLYSLLCSFPICARMSVSERRIHSVFQYIVLLKSLGYDHACGSRSPVNVHLPHWLSAKCYYISAYSCKPIYDTLDGQWFFFLCQKPFEHVHFDSISFFSLHSIFIWSVSLQFDNTIFHSPNCDDVRMRQLVEKRVKM